MSPVDGKEKPCEISIEHQLAHKVSDPLGRAYNRTQFIKERHDMMQGWSDDLDTLKSDSKVQTGT